MNNRDLVIVVFVITFLLFGLFLTIVHFMRRSDASEREKPGMEDFREIDVIGTLIYFFKVIKERRNRNKK